MHGGKDGLQRGATVELSRKTEGMVDVTSIHQQSGSERRKSAHCKTALPDHSKGSKCGGWIPRVVHAWSRDRTTFSSGRVRSPRSWNMRERPYPTAVGATIMRGRLVASAMAGSSLARLRTNSVDAVNSVTDDKSKIPTFASVAVEYFGMPF
jgi:hypothetical protein